jgi:hypothetical protein
MMRRSAEVPAGRVVSIRRRSRSGPRAAAPLFAGLACLACASGPVAPPTTPPVSTSAGAEAPPEVPCGTYDPNADRTAAPPDVAAPPSGARRSASGLHFCVLREGSGELRPTREGSVRVHYTGWTTDGVMFDSSYARGEPAVFPVSAVIRGWTESLIRMTVGQVRRVWIPEELAYGGRPGAPAGMLVFDIELLAIEGE